VIKPRGKAEIQALHGSERLQNRVIEEEWREGRKEVKINASDLWSRK
jgi:hypothetical protein